MSKADDPTPEDIAGLFRKFGGDAHGYKEFAPPDNEAEAPRAWPLITGEKISHAPVPVAAPLQAPAAPMRSAPAPAPAQAPYLAPVAAPLLFDTPIAAPIAAPIAPPVAAPRARVEPVLRPATLPPAPALSPVFSPARAPAPLPPLENTGAAQTPLAQLFERLVSPQPPAPPPGPMSRWRRPT